ncbi:hypothetical protein StrepF001_12795 [Streptomyces sp. F001]|nr:hypothetical protein StrepF001_12795 [Streptomyces sp. F001]
MLQFQTAVESGEDIEVVVRRDGGDAPAVANGFDGGGCAGEGEGAACWLGGVDAGQRCGDGSAREQVTEETDRWNAFWGVAEVFRATLTPPLPVGCASTHCCTTLLRKTRVSAASCRSAQGIWPR